MDEFQTKEARESMTRANLVIIAACGQRTCLEFGSDASPSEGMARFLGNLAIMEYGPDLEWLQANNPAGMISIGEVGNPSYFYEVDQRTHTVRAWNAKTRWVNAPDDWQERGYGCYKGTNGRYGYTNWIKGKNISDEINVVIARDSLLENARKMRPAEAVA